MKVTAFCSVLMLTALLVFSPSFTLEAKHHKRVSVSFGPMFSVGSPSYVVKRYNAYPVQREIVYVDQFGYPYYRESVYSQPYVERVYSAPRPLFFNGFSFGLNFMR
jgi:hypothetical protein